MIFGSALLNRVWEWTFILHKQVFLFSFVLFLFSFVLFLFYLNFLLFSLINSPDEIMIMFGWCFDGWNPIIEVDIRIKYIYIYIYKKKEILIIATKANAVFDGYNTYDYVWLQQMSADYSWRY